MPIDKPNVKSHTSLLSKKSGKSNGNTPYLEQDPRTKGRKVKISKSMNILTPKV